MKEPNCSGDTTNKELAASSSKQYVVSELNLKVDKSDESTPTCSSYPERENSDQVECNTPKERNTTLFLELDNEIDRQLEEKAERSNLSVVNVKNMLKAVLTNEEVLKMVDYNLCNSAEKPSFEPKLTRSKIKELLGSFNFKIPHMVDTSTPQKKSGLEELIQNEWPEDSSDEEYDPLVDSAACQSEEEDSKADDTLNDDELSEMSSFPHSTPADEDDSEGKKISDNTTGDRTDTLENPIGQRTRSKYSLSETPLEAIEQAFVPPDITTDMYNTHCDNQDWLNFLKEFMQPLGEGNDDDNDPEYNVMLDVEQEGTDKEELRRDRAVKITKKELNDLMSELCEYTEMCKSDEDDKVSEKDEENETNLTEVAPNVDFPTAVEPSIQPNLKPIVTLEQPPMELENIIDTILNSQPFTSEFELDKLELDLVKQHLRQHCQLLLQCALLSLGNPHVTDEAAAGFRKMLFELHELKNRSSENSFFNIDTLDQSLRVFYGWKKKLESPEELSLLHSLIVDLPQQSEKYKKTRRYHLPQVPPHLIEHCLESSAFQYPLLLPINNFKLPVVHTFERFSPLETELLAVGLSTFRSLLGLNFRNKNDLIKSCEKINQYLMPTKNSKMIMTHIMRTKHLKSNPVQDLLFYDRECEREHFVIKLLYDGKLKLYQNATVLLVDIWDEYARKRIGEKRVKLF